MALSPTSSRGSGGGAANVSANTIIQTRSGSPVGALTPTAIGALCQDLTTGGIYIAIGATSADWIQVGGAGGSGGNAEVEGVLALTGSLTLTSRAAGNVNLTDLGAAAGTGNALSWSGNSADGSQTLDLFLGSTGQYQHTWGADGSYKAARGIKTGRQTSAALPTVQLVTATGAQIDTVSDRETHTPVTFNPGVATTATCKVELSPDNTTYSELATITKPVGTVFDGEIDDVVVRVPAGWYIRLTVNAQAAIGTTTYY